MRGGASAGAQRADRHETGRRRYPDNGDQGTHDVLRGGRGYIASSISDAQREAMTNLPERITEYAGATPVYLAALLHLRKRGAMDQALSRLGRSGRRDSYFRHAGSGRCLMST